MHSKTSLVRNSDHITYKMQKPCNENPSLKYTYLFHTQRFIDSWSISTVLSPFIASGFPKVTSIIITTSYLNSTALKSCCYPWKRYLKKINEKKKKTIKRKVKQTKTGTTDNRPCLHHRWRYYQAIALNDQ